MTIPEDLLEFWGFPPFLMDKFFHVLRSSLKTALFVAFSGFSTPSLILVALHVADLIDMSFPSFTSVEQLYLWMSKTSDFKHLNINLNL